MTTEQPPHALPVAVLDMAVRWLRSPDAPDPAVVCYACGLSTEQLMEACGDYGCGHCFVADDNGMEGHWRQRWQACCWCNAVDEEDGEMFMEEIGS